MAIGITLLFTNESTIRIHLSLINKRAMMTNRLRLIPRALHLLPRNRLIDTWIESIFYNFVEIKFPNGAVTALFQVLAAVDVEVTLVHTGRVVASSLG